MAGRSRFETISEPDFANVLQVLSATTKGRAFLQEYRQRSRPEETLGLLQALGQIEATLANVREQLKPERIADEVRHIAMTLDIALDGALVDDTGEEAARRFALVERARQELGALANVLLVEAAAPAPATAGSQPAALHYSEAGQLAAAERPVTAAELSDAR
jgi:hypothetical protein